MPCSALADIADSGDMCVVAEAGLWFAALAACIMGEFTFSMEPLGTVWLKFSSLRVPGATRSSDTFSSGRQSEGSLLQEVRAKVAAVTASNRVEVNFIEVKLAGVKI